MMYKLPSKFTGINADRIEFNKFKTLCYSLQGLGLFEVLDISGYEYPKNYYCASVSDEQGKYHFYVNCFVYVGCFGEISEESEVYLDKKEVALATSRLEQSCVILPSETLYQQANFDNFDLLRRSELSETQYWLPSTIGRLLFSWYFD
ncbi:MAG: hypothetical protein ACRBHB_12345 [Arenicella sp.]